MTGTILATRPGDREGFYQEELNNIIAANRMKAGALIRILQQAQNLAGYLSPETLEVIADEMAVPVAKVYGVVTFYNYFSMVPKGKHIIQVCTGTSCYVKGGQKILENFDKKLGLKPKGITGDGLFSLETVRCLGACGLSPVLSIDGEIHGRVRPNNLEDILNRYK